jgi:uncharacterized protein (DUF1330 family)
MSTSSPSYGQIDRDYAMRLATIDPAEDGPVWMVNLMQYRTHADYGEGDADISGREADDRYAPTEILADIGAEVVVFGDVESQLLGDHPRWDRVGVVRYPSRRAFIAMQSRPDFRAKHEHKQAGMATTIVMGCQPTHVPPWPDTVAAPRNWDEVEHPPTDDDGSVVVLHVVKYAPGDGVRSMVSYQNHAAVVAGRHGGQVAAWFDVEGTIVGDGRAWDQARFNRFPSKAAFMAVVLDPERLAAQREHREPAMTDTYTLIVRPTIDRLGTVSP